MLYHLSRKDEEKQEYIECVLTTIHLSLMANVRWEFCNECIYYDKVSHKLFIFSTMVSYSFNERWCHIYWSFDLICQDCYVAIVRLIATPRGKRNCDFLKLWQFFCSKKDSYFSPCVGSKRSMCQDRRVKVICGGKTSQHSLTENIKLFY